MPSRKAVDKGPARLIEREAEEEDRSGHSESVLSAEEEEEEDETGDETIQLSGKKRKSKPAALKKADMKRWRRLAVEEKEAITNEGGIVWRTAQPLLLSLPSKAKKDASNHIRDILSNVEVKLDKLLVPRTTSMPHATRNTNLVGGLASASTGSITGSIMSWQVESGDRLYNEEGMEEDLDKRDEVALLELGGFSSDIAILEALLLPEATETVSLSRAIEEQERELESSRARLQRLKDDWESRGNGGEAASAAVSKLQFWFTLSFLCCC